MFYFEYGNSRPPLWGTSQAELKRTQNHSQQCLGQVAQWSDQVKWYCSSLVAQGTKQCWAVNCELKACKTWIPDYRAISPVQSLL